MKSYRDEILKFAKKKYDVTPEFLCQKFPTYAVLRNKDNKKWFATIMRVPSEKLGLASTGEVEVMNIKCEPLGVIRLLDEGKGFLPAYHMNKTYWITVLLDGSVELKRIQNLLKMSFDLVNGKRNN